VANGGVTDATNTTRERAGDIKHRKRLSTLTDDEVRALRKAFKGLQEISDSRGYGHFASLHGFPEPGYCEHSNQLFLPWHRGYLYFFEEALQDVVDGVTLPWWDYWASDDVPEAFAHATSPDGEVNPLFDAAITTVGGVRDPSWPERTRRPTVHPGVPGGRLPTEDEIADAHEAANFDDFTFAIEQIHNRVHRWVGGEFANQRFAGWDPLFWAHHTMVDRLWAPWQIDNPGATPRREHLPKGLNYFKDMTVEATLDVTDLGYDYAATEVLVHA
jgi:tyrosinase